MDIINPESDKWISTPDLEKNDGFQLVQEDISSLQSSCKNPKCNKVEIKIYLSFSVFFPYNSFAAFIDQEEKPAN